MNGIGNSSIIQKIDRSYFNRGSRTIRQFLWMTTDESKEIDNTKLDRIKSEISDILIYMIYLCNVLNIDLIKEAGNKMDINRKKYTVRRSKGSNKKNTEF